MSGLKGVKENAYKGETKEAAAEPIIEKSDAPNILFATPTCPNCKLAAALLDKAGIPYEKMIAEEHPDLVEKYGIKQAPTLVMINGDSFEKFRGVSDIKGYLSAVKA